MSTTTPIDPVPRDLINVGGHAHRWLESLRRNLNSITGSGSGIDHGSLAGLSDDDHTHYSRADGARAFTGVVGGIDPTLSTHLATKNYVDTTIITDHTALTNIGVNTHAQIDTHIADSTIHFTEGSIDHGSIGGLLDDDHTQYSLADGTRAFTGTVGGIDPTLSTHLTTKNYVDTEIANNTYWSRTSTTLSTKTANDDLQIDSFVRVNGSSDTQQLIVKGHSTQTANLQEWQNSSGSTLASISSTGKLIFTSNGLVDFGNWTLSEGGVTLYYTLSGGIRATVQNGLHATYGWELSWQNTSNSNRFGFISPSEGKVELRGTKNITTSSMSFSVYNTYTDSSNYERAVFDWKTTANTLRIGTEAFGTGTVRPIEIQGAGTTILGDAATDVPLTIKGASSQTANLFELDDSSGKKRMSVSSNGNLITLGRTDYAAWQGINDTCTITTGVGGGNSTTACDLVIRPASDSLLADTYIYAGYKLSNGGGSGNLTIGQEDFVGNASPAGMGTVTIRTGSMASQSGGSFDGGTLAITTGGGGGIGSIGTPAGAGGAINVTLGNGKASGVASVIAGAGGSFTLTAGNGAVASGATSTGGDGGSIVLTAGAKGTGTDADGVNGIIDLNSTTKIKALRETKVNSTTTETVSVDSATYIKLKTSSETLSLSDMVDGSKITIRNASGGNVYLNFDIISGTTTYSAPVTMPDGDSYELIYDSEDSAWVM